MSTIMMIMIIIMIVISVGSWSKPLNKNPLERIYPCQMHTLTNLFMLAIAHLENT